MTQQERYYRELAANIRINALEGFEAVGAGHVGGTMSMCDLMAVLYGGVMKVDPKNPDWADRDWLVVSKGHCGPGLYAALCEAGYFPKDEMRTLNKPGTRLPSHCDRLKTPGVDMTTGSLGQGMSTAIGVAFGHKYQGKPNRTFLVLGDGECQEGQVWEGAMFAAQHKLDNLTAFVDNNQKQLDGYLSDICDLGDIAQKFRDFGWNALECDGHDVMALQSAIELARDCTGKPTVIVMHTEKGRGCSFTEDVLYNHHVPVSPEDKEKAVERIRQEIKALREGCA